MSEARWAALILPIAFLVTACDEGSTDPPVEEYTEIRIDGTVLSWYGGPVAGAAVDLGPGQVDSTAATVALYSMASTLSDSAGQFFLQADCSGSRWLVRAERAGFFSMYPGIGHVAEVACEEGTQKVSVVLTPHSQALRFAPEDVAVNIGDAVAIEGTVVFVDDTEGFPMHMLWAITADEGGQCGTLSENYGPTAIFLAPDAVPAGSACGGAEGQVGIRLYVYDDVKGIVRGVEDTTYVTILP